MGVFTRSTEEVHPEAKPYNEPRVLRASAQVVRLDTRTEIDAFSRANARATATDAWQTAAWDYFDEVGEVKYAFYVMANTCSRIRIYPGVVTDPARPPQHVNEVASLTPGLADCANAAMKKLGSGPGGIPALLRDLALNLSVPGEGYLVQIPERLGSELPETWAIYSSDAVKVDSQGNVALKLSPHDKTVDYVTLPKTAFVGRIWRSHPRYANEADSSMRGLLGLLEELMLLNRTVRATARSRLNAGLLYLPDGLSIRSEATPFPDDLDDTVGADPTPAGTGDDEDEFEQELIDAMTTPIQDEDSASAVVPLIVRGPAELGAQISLIKFERAFDPALAARATAVLDRILSGLDIPKEVVKGLADVKYSNAVVIDDQFFRSNVEPLVLMMVDAITTVFVRQYIVAHGFNREQADQIVCWYDPKDVIVRPDQNEDANLGFDRYALSEEAWRRTHGFSEDDAPDVTEVVKRLVISKGQIPDALTEALLRVFAPEVMAKATQASPDAQSNLPPEVQQALGVPPSQAPVPPAAPPPTAQQDAQPTPAPPIPAPPNARPRNPDEPITAPPSAPSAGNPAA
jgi:hypothetical protein